MDNYKKECPIDGGTCGQGGTCFACENEALGSRLAAAEARIAELEPYNAGLATESHQQQKRIAALEKALRKAAGRLERYAVQVDGEWGLSREADELYADGEMPEELLAANELLKEKE